MISIPAPMLRILRVLLRVYNFEGRTEEITQHYFEYHFYVSVVGTDYAIHTLYPIKSEPLWVTYTDHKEVTITRPIARQGIYWSYEEKCNILLLRLKNKKEAISLLCVNLTEVNIKTKLHKKYPEEII